MKHPKCLKPKTQINQIHIEEQSFTNYCLRQSPILVKQPIWREPAKTLSIMRKNNTTNATKFNVHSNWSVQKQNMIDSSMQTCDEITLQSPKPTTLQTLEQRNSRLNQYINDSTIDEIEGSSIEQQFKALRLRSLGPVNSPYRATLKRKFPPQVFRLIHSDLFNTHFALKPNYQKAQYQNSIVQILRSRLKTQQKQRIKFPSEDTSNFI